MNSFENKLGGFINKKDIFLREFLMMYINKSISMEDIKDIKNKIENVIYEIDLNNNFIYIINMISLSDNLNEIIDDNLLKLNKNLNVQKEIYENVKSEFEKLNSRNESPFGIKYQKYIEDKYFKFSKKVEDISKLRTIYEDISSYEQSNNIYSTLKKIPKKELFLEFENNVYKLIEFLNNKKYSMYNSNVKDLISGIPNIKDYKNIKDFKESSLRYKKDELHNICKTIIYNVFTLNDYENIYNIYQDLDKKLMDSRNFLSKNNNYYNIDMESLNIIYNKYVDKLNEINSIKEDIDYYVDQINLYQYNIKKLDDINMLFGKFNKFINEREGLVEFDFKMISLKILGKLEGYDLLYKKYFLNDSDKKFKDNIKIIDIDEPIINLDKENFKINIDKEIEILQIENKEILNKKEIKEVNEKNRIYDLSFYA